MQQVCQHKCLHIESWEYVSDSDCDKGFNDKWIDVNSWSKYFRLCLLDTM